MILCNSGKKKKKEEASKKNLFKVNKNQIKKYSCDFEWGHHYKKVDPHTSKTKYMNTQNPKIPILYRIEKYSLDFGARLIQIYED